MSDAEPTAMPAWPFEESYFTEEELPGWPGRNVPTASADAALAAVEATLDEAGDLVGTRSGEPDGRGDGDATHRSQAVRVIAPLGRAPEPRSVRIAVGRRVLGRRRAGSTVESHPSPGAAGAAARPPTDRGRAGSAGRSFENATTTSPRSPKGERPEHT